MSLRLAVLWTSVSGYLSSCLRSLTNRYAVNLDVTRLIKPGPKPHPFDDGMFSWMPQLRNLYGGSASLAPKLLAELNEFDPQVLIVAGWAVPAYRRIARLMRQRGIYVIGTADNPWRGTLRQWLGVLSAKWYIQPLYDALWVPGERGANFARKLGFRNSRLLYGLYAADQPYFAQLIGERTGLSKSEWPRRFLFAGRLVPEKGIDVLIQAYRQYRLMDAAPWELWIAGSGPLKSFVEHEPGVRLLGFVQPSDYLDVLRQVGVFVLPSQYDPWPLVIHEMTSAGLPVLCSRQCGSSVELVQDGLNGFTFESWDVNALAHLMARMSSGAIDLVAMGHRSSVLSTRYSPAQWADYLMNHILEHVPII